jgi:hypothetical protein
MTKLLYTLLFALIFSSGWAQSFEGVLQIDYHSESGTKNAVDIYVKGDKFLIKKVFGGCDRYDAYIYDTKSHMLICMSPVSPKTALHMDIDKVLDIYETKQLKPGYKIHMSQPYTSTSQSKKISDNKVTQKKATDENTSYEIWTSDLKINYSALIPLLRVTGFWGATEDGNNAILESKTTNKKTSKSSTVSVVVIKNKVDDNVFKISPDYQQVDLDKFLVNEYKSPRFGDLVKAFTAF